MTCASTLVRSDFELRREAPLFATIGFPHAENVLILAPQRVADNDKASFQKPEAIDSSLTVVRSRVLYLYRKAFEDQRSILEVQAARR